jgi:integrase
MAKTLLTYSYVNALRPKERRYSVYDEKADGLELRVSSTGRKTWACVYRLPGQKTVRRLTLGTYPEMSLRKARRSCAQAKRDLAGGLNPVETQRSPRADDPTVGDAISAFLADRTNLRSHGEYRRILSRYVPPELKRRSIGTIGRRDVKDLMEDVKSGKFTKKQVANANGREVAANRVRAILSSMFRYAIEKEWMETNPCQYVKPYRERSRDRVLTRDEIYTWWNKLEECPISPTTGNALRLMLITGQRSSDLLRAEWVDIHWNEALWVVPAHKTKNGKPNKIPLSAFAGLILGFQQHVARASPFLFPSPRSADSPIGLTALSRASNRARSVMGIAHWTPHDLRRSAITWMSELGAPAEILRKILNHAENSVTDRYDRAEKLEQKRQWLQTWSEKLDEIVRGEEQE